MCNLNGKRARKSMGKRSPDETEHNRHLYSLRSPDFANQIKTLVRAVDAPSSRTSSGTRAEQQRNTFSGFKAIISLKTVTRRPHSKIREHRNGSISSVKKHSGNSSYGKSPATSLFEQNFENSQPKLNSISHNIYNGMMTDQTLFHERHIHRKTLIAYERGSFKNYCDQCTIHGLKYVGDGTLPKFERIFWMISVLIALCGAAFFICHLYSKFTTSPIIISRAPESVSIEQIPFPALTVCNMNNVKKSFAEKINRGRDELRKFLLKDVCNKDVNTQLVSDWVKKKAGESARIEKFLINATQTCSEMLYHCEWNNTEMNCTELFNPVYTDEGLCYNFNSVRRMLWKGRIRDGLDITWASDKHVDWNPEYVFKRSDPPSAIPWRGRGSGASHGLTLVLDVDVDEYYCSSTANVGFKMLLHSPVELPQMREYGFTLSPGKETRVIITPHITDADDSIRKISPKIRQCYFLNEKRLRYYRVYTQRNCQLECEANFTLQMCHCMQYYMPAQDDTKICDQTNDQCVATVKRILDDDPEDAKVHNNGTLLVPNCKCYPGCYEIDYSTEISQSMLVASFEVGQKYFKNNPTYYEKNIAIVHVFYVEGAYLKYRKNELYGFVDLLSNTGGLLGLFMGFSLLSVTEIMYYVLLRIWTVVHKKRKEKKAFRAFTGTGKRDSVYPFAQ